MTETNSDLRKANDRMDRKRQRRADYKARTGERRLRRDRCRLLALLTGTGVLRSW